MAGEVGIGRFARKKAAAPTVEKTEAAEGLLSIAKMDTINVPATATATATTNPSHQVDASWDEGFHHENDFGYSEHDNGGAFFDENNEASSTSNNFVTSSDDAAFNDDDGFDEGSFGGEGEGGGSDNIENINFQSSGGTESAIATAAAKPKITFGFSRFANKNNAASSSTSSSTSTSASINSNSNNDSSNKVTPTRTGPNFTNDNTRVVKQSGINNNATSSSMENNKKTPSSSTILPSSNVVTAPSVTGYDLSSLHNNTHTAREGSRRVSFENSTAGNRNTRVSVPGRPFIHEKVKPKRPFVGNLPPQNKKQRLGSHDEKQKQTKTTRTVGPTVNVAASTGAANSNRNHGDISRFGHSNKSTGDGARRVSGEVTMKGKGNKNFQQQQHRQHAYVTDNRQMRKKASATAVTPSFFTIAATTTRDGRNGNVNVSNTANYSQPSVVSNKSKDNDRRYATATGTGTANRNGNGNRNAIARRLEEESARRRNPAQFVKPTPATDSHGIVASLSKVVDGNANNLPPFHRDAVLVQPAGFRLNKNGETKDDIDQGIGIGIGNGNDIDKDISNDDGFEFRQAKFLTDIRDTEDLQDQIGTGLLDMNDRFATYYAVLLRDLDGAVDLLDKLEGIDEMVDGILTGC